MQILPQRSNAQTARIEIAAIFYWDRCQVSAPGLPPGGDRAIIRRAARTDQVADAITVHAIATVSSVVWLLAQPRPDVAGVPGTIAVIAAGGAGSDERPDARPIHAGAEVRSRWRVHT